MNTNRAFQIIGIWLLWGLTGCTQTETGTPPAKRELVLPVQIGKVVFKDVSDEVQGVGNIAAEQRVTITTEVDGRIRRISIEEGAHVRGGEVLARIDSRDYKLEVERLRAERDSAREEYEKALKGLRPEDQEKLEAQVQSDESALELAIKEHKRAARLFRDGVISQSKLDEANDKVVRARETLRSSRAALNAGTRSRDEDIAKAKSALDAVTKQLDMAELDLAKTVIRAPFDGVVLTKKIEVGAYAAVGAPVLEMIASNRLKAVIELPQSYRGKLEQVRRIDFEAPDLGLKFTQDKNLARQVRVIPDANIFSGNIKVQIDLPDPNPALFPGLTLRSVFHFDTRPKVKHVPSIALVIGEQGTVVYTVKEGHAHLVPVKAHKEKDGLVEVEDFTRQLSPEVDVILRGSGAVFPGARVLVTNPKPEVKTPFNAAEKKPSGAPSQKPEI